MADAPFVSVVIPVKNEEDHIEACLRGVLSQSYPKNRFEIIVVDNGSEDKTMNILGHYHKLPNVTVLVQNGGTISKVRNRGAKTANGSIIAFLDGDCVPDPNWLENGVDLLMSDRQIGCVGFVISEPGPNATWVEKVWYHMSSTSKYRGTTFVDWLSSFNLILWNHIFKQVGGFNETLITCEDAEFGYRIGEKNKLLISDSVKVRHLGESKSLREFFKREFWRGKSNLKGFFISSNKRRDSLSTFVPVAYVLFVFLLLSWTVYELMTWNISWQLFVLTILTFIGPPVTLSFLKVKARITIKERGQIITLFCLYLLARGLSVLSVRN